ncbi:MAG: spore germination protein [Clostridiales bacterium]|jgi:spore germination protein KA|nr:spore germination protein [Clostridiales bacterium]
MVKKLTKLFNNIVNAINNKHGLTPEVPSSVKQESRLSRRLALNLRQLKQALGDSSDIVTREFSIGEQPPVHAALVFVDGLTGKPLVQEHVMKSLMIKAPREIGGKKPDLSKIRENLLTIADVKEERDLKKIIHSVLSGDSALLIDGCPVALLTDTRAWESRGISEPVAEGGVRGPRDGFVETLRINTALLRRHLKSPDLRIETMILGNTTRTDVAIAYVQGIVNEQILEKVRQDLSRIDTDSILDSSYLEELMRGHPYTPFPMYEHSERPDKIVASLLEGRVAILVDGTPFVIVVPTILFQFFQASEDYYTIYHVSTFLRWLRLLGFLLSLYLPSLYIAVITIHHELIPTSLALALAGAREGIPFPALAEALLMEIAFESLREAGVRLPKPLGQAVSIVGALIIGDAAVRAGLVSPAMVIIVAFTGIASFTVPSYKLIFTTRMLRFPMMLAAAFLGLPGIIMVSVVLLAHLTTLKSFGVPYLSPLAPYSGQDLKDVLARAPWWAMRRRPQSLRSPDPVRQESGLRPTLSGKKPNE